jgi:RNA polymerase sigma-70 factor (ECF subfamily)
MGSMAPTRHLEQSEGERASGDVVRLPFFDSDTAVVAALRARQAAGGAALYDRHHANVRRVLVRLVGPSDRIDDLVQDVFLIAIDTIGRLEQPESLGAWLSGIAVFRARAEIRARARSRWFPLFSDDDLPETDARVATPEIDEAVRTTYRVLDKLPVDERIAFALRYVDGMELVAVAEACDVSLATIKRRLRRAQAKFLNIARTHAVLSEWLERGERWK